MALSANEIRRIFIDFYVAKGHTLVPSAPLVPADDPTLLFTSAGMVQFKKYYAGTVHLPFRRAVSVQKCLRVSDIDDVGRTPRHDTFFEMLGHFSFGDYFKKEAITWNWELFTKVYGIDPERLIATVYEEDDEAWSIWRDVVGLPEDRILRMGAEDNFWGPAGETGACGPSSELLYDLGPDADPEHPDARPGEENNRFVEVGNFVFPQFDRQSDGTDLPLANRGIDTGIGLERLAMVLQGKKSIFHTDLFWPLLQRASEICSAEYEGNEVPLHIIADHARALTFALGEGIVPSNEGRGYVIRRLIRRAAVQGYNLGVKEPFLYKLVETVVEMMKDVYPEVESGRKRAELALRNEEERFGSTLEQGVIKMESFLEKARKEGREQLSGEEAFLLYDTYGIPLELVRDMALGRGLSVDEEGFEALMEKQKERSRAASTFHSGGEDLEWVRVSDGPESEFVGYETLEADVRVRRLARTGGGRRILVVTDRTPFYGEAGGQVGDRGRFDSGDLRAEVVDAVKEDSTIIHVIEAAGDREADELASALADASRTWEARVDRARRDATRRHHTATHLLQAALRQVLGDHVAQAGSLVSPERLRFDFTHFSAMSAEELERVERIVNEKILEAIPVEIRYSTYDEAVRDGVTALFGEKYDHARVRRVRIGEFSEELCGGTHLDNTAQAGLFVIVSESAVSAGTRRIEALCGLPALEFLGRYRRDLERTRRLLGSTPEAVPERVQSLLDEVARLKKDLARARRGEVGGQIGRLVGQAEARGKFKFTVGTLEASSAAEMRSLGDELRRRLGSGAAVVASVVGGKVMFLAVATDDVAGEILSAGDLVKEVAATAGGSGGGRAHMALGGGKDPRKIEAALEVGKQRMREAFAAAGA